jgi:hypothetical protein
MSETKGLFSLSSLIPLQALLPHPDGTVHMYDLSRLCESPTKIVPNPDVSEGVIMDLASSPRNVDFLVVATYGMHVLYHVISFIEDFPVGSLFLWQFVSALPDRNAFSILNC